MGAVIEELAGNLGDGHYDGLEVDYLDVEWHDAHKRIARISTRSGLELGLRLSDAASRRGLRQDDVICADGRRAVAVNILSCPCVSVEVSGRASLARLCYEVGNRHAPLFYGESAGEGADSDSDAGMDAERLLMPYDEPMFAMMEKLGFSPKKVEARLMPEKRISGGCGPGTHSHGH